VRAVTVGIIFGLGSKTVTKEIRYGGRMVPTTRLYRWWGVKLYEARSSECGTRWAWRLVGHVGKPIRIPRGLHAPGSLEEAAKEFAAQGKAVYLEKIKDSQEVLLTPVEMLATKGKA